MNKKIDFIFPHIYIRIYINNLENDIVITHCLKKRRAGKKKAYIGVYIGYSFRFTYDASFILV